MGCVDEPAHFMKVLFFLISKDKLKLLTLSEPPMTSDITPLRNKVGLESFFKNKTEEERRKKEKKKERK